MRTWYSRAQKDLAATLRRRADEARRKVLETAKRRGIEPPEAPPIPTGESRLRQAYAFLRSILQTAVRDGLIGSNPCQIVGAGTVKHAERPLLPPDALAAIVEAMPDQWTLPVRVMFGARLRIGEVVALRRGDYAKGMLRVERQTIRVRGEFITTLTKTGNAMDRAGHSTARAALIYQHVAKERGTAIAAGLGALAGAALEPHANAGGRLESVVRVDVPGL